MGVNRHFRKKYWRAASLLVTAGVLFTTTGVQANYRPMDTEAPYEGEVLMAVNPNHNITSEEALRDSSQCTGLPANLPMNRMLESEQTTSEKRCGTMLIQQKKPVTIPVEKLQNNAREVKKEEYTIGTEKEIGDIETGKTYTLKMVDTGTTWTLWEPKDSPLNEEKRLAYAEALENLIMPRMQESFGDWKWVDVDRDGKVAFVFHPTDFMGYFWMGDLYPKELMPGSNEMDMVHITSENGEMDRLLTTLSHELQHLINFARTGMNMDVWLNEVFSESAQVIAGVGVNKDGIPEGIGAIEHINKKGFLFLYAFEGEYVPRDDKYYASEPYGCWLLFGRYLAYQTKDFTGGGDEFYKSVLDKGSCTKETVMQVLQEIGYLDSPGAPSDFEELLMNFAAAVLLRDTEGVYSLNQDPDQPSVLDGIKLPEVKVNVAGVNQTTLMGAGAACYVQNDAELVLGKQGPDIRLAGLSREQADLPGEETEPGKPGQPGAGGETDEKPQGDAGKEPDEDTGTDTNQNVGEETEHPDPMRKDETGEVVATGDQELPQIWMLLMLGGAGIMGAAIRVISKRKQKA